MIAIDYRMVIFVALPEKIGANVAWELVLVQRKRIDDSGDNR